MKASLKWPLGLSVLVVLANLQILTTRRTVKWDAFDETWNYLRWIGSALRQGYFPDYFPQILSGYPLGSNMNAGVYNLGYLSSAWLFPDSVLSVNLVYIATQIGVCLLAFYIGRSYRLPDIASFYLALATTASGYMVGHATHFAFTASVPALLSCFLAIRMALAQRNKAAFFLASFGVYHGFTAGYPINLAFGAQLLVLYWLVAFVRTVESRKSLLLLLVGVAFGLILSFPSLWHFFNLLNQSARGEGLSAWGALQFSLPRYALGSFPLPLLKLGYTEPTIERFNLLFVSFPLLIVTVWGLAARKISPSGWWYLVLALLCLELALGSQGLSPLRAWLAEHVTLYRMGRFPSGEHRGEALFLLALFTALGVAWLAGHLSVRQKGVLISVIALDFLIVMYGLKFMRITTIDPEYRGQVPRYQVVFDAGQQHLLDRPRLCGGEGHDWVATASVEQRDLAPDRFYWNGYTPLRLRAYDQDKKTLEKFICGASRLWDSESGQPHGYALVRYTPGEVALRVTTHKPDTRMLWTDTDDGFWQLSIDGENRELVSGPGALRYFHLPEGNHEVIMTYRGPLSRLWRKP